MDIHFQVKSAAISVALATLISCGGGGGGGGGGGDTALQYSGNTSAAVITTGNAAALTANIAGTSDVAKATSSIAPSDEAASANGAIDLNRELTRAFRSALGKLTSGDGGLTSVPIDSGPLPCDNGGTVRVVGDVDPLSGRGTATVTYTNCQVDQDVLNGQATMRIDAAVTGVVFTPTDFTITFTRLTLRGTANVDIAGSVQVVADIFANRETITENVVALYNNTGRMTKSENIVYVNQYDNINNPTSFTETMTGRLFDSVHGFVDIATVTPLVFSDAGRSFPNGGALQLVGAGARQIQATALSSDRVKIALDVDNVPGFESVAFLGWTELSGPLGADLGDGDSDGMHNSWETANPSAIDAAIDTDGDGFSNLSEYLGGGNPAAGGSTPSFALSSFTVASDVSSAISDTEMPGRSSIASDGTNYLLVTCREFPTPGVYGTVVSDGGQVLNTFLISNDACPQRTAVAYDGTNYLVIVSRNGELFGIRVTPLGNILDSGGGFLIASNAGGSTHFLPAAAFDGTNYLVVWRKFIGTSFIQARFIAPNGVPVSPDFLVGTTGADGQPFMAFAGGRYLVAWTSTSLGNANVLGQLVETTGLLAGGPLNIALLGGEQSAGGVASDGSNFLVVWDHMATTGTFPPPDGQIFGRTVNVSNGLLGPTIDIATGLFQNHSASVTFAGSSYVVAWGVSSFPNFPPAGIYATRVSRNGVRVDGPPTDIGVPVSGSPPNASRLVNPVAASKGQTALISWVNNIEVSGQRKDILAASVFGP